MSHIATIFLAVSHLHDHDHLDPAPLTPDPARLQEKLIMLEFPSLAFCSDRLLAHLICSTQTRQQFIVR